MTDKDIARLNRKNEIRDLDISLNENAPPPRKGWWTHFKDWLAPEELDERTKAKFALAEEIKAGKDGKVQVTFKSAEHPSEVIDHAWLRCIPRVGEIASLKSGNFIVKSVKHIVFLTDSEILIYVDKELP